MRAISRTPMSRMPSLACTAAVNPATSVPSTSKKAPISGPSAPASTSAMLPGNRSAVCNSDIVAGQAQRFVDPLAQRLLEGVGVGDRRRVEASADEARAGAGQQDDHQCHAGQWADRILLLDANAGDV